MEPDIRQLVQALHDSPVRIMVVAAGAGTRALSDLLGVPGASRTLLEALVPYSEAAFVEFLGQRPEQFVAADTARLLAGRAFTRARWLEAATNSNPVIGLACSATIITDRPKRGEHRAHVATWRTNRLTWHGLHLCKGARDRTGEEGLVSRIMLNSLAQAAGIDYQLAIPLVDGDLLEVETRDFGQVTEQLQWREIDSFCVEDNGRIHTNVLPRYALLCGSFNPLHDGHLRMAHTASRILEQPVAFELSALNVDKPPLSADTILSRIAQFAGRWPIVVSNAPSFVEKAQRFPGSTFIVGYDTAERILQPHYYHNSHQKMLAALAYIRDQGCRFLVAGRVNQQGRFQQLDHLDTPTPFRDLFQAIPATQFRKDISSSQLRQSGQRGSR
jgi:nicotinic acid mononucleotide adenylyltransferase